MLRLISLPSSNKTRHGMELTLYSSASFGFSSMSTDTILNFSLNSSSMTPTIWHGPHQEALKSTRTRPF